MNGDELAQEIAESVNSGIDTSDFQEQIRSEHNYLQREMFNQVFRQGITALASVEYTDRRNENAVGLARDICDHMNWKY